MFLARFFLITAETQGLLVQGDMKYIIYGYRIRDYYVSTIYLHLYTVHVEYECTMYIRVPFTIRYMCFKIFPILLSNISCKSYLGEDYRFGFVREKLPYSIIFTFIRICLTNNLFRNSASISPLWTHLLCVVTLAFACLFSVSIVHLHLK
jgi:hypothetical protein